MRSDDEAIGLVWNDDERAIGALGWIGLVWGIGGVLALLATAIARLFPMALESLTFDLGLEHWIAYGASLVFMGWSEGYRGFQKAFSPRVVARGFALARDPKVAWVIFAPAFCMGFFHAKRKRVVLAWALTLGMVCLVLLVRHVPQPWRGIIDVGVVIGLAWGIVAMVVFLIHGLAGRAFPVSADLPERTDPVLPVSVLGTES